MKKIAIIGGGAAGLMCAATILKNARKNVDYHIDLYDRNPHLGAKVIISGGGRCNVTTGIQDWDTLQSKYIRGSSMVANLFADFGPRDIKKWFESHGVSLKEEADKRIFPCSDDGNDIVRVFEKIFSAHAKNITLRRKTSVTQIVPIDAAHYDIIDKEGMMTQYDSIVIATGGNAYAHTGSRGDGYAFARSLGHTVTDLGPSLASLEINDEWLHTLSGCSFASAALTTRAQNEHFIIPGPLLITHFGLSGPAIFTLAAHLAFTTFSKENPHDIAFIPDHTRSADAWDTYIAQESARDGKRKCETHLEKVLPKSFVKAFMGAFAHDIPMKSAELSKKKRREIASLLGNGIPLHVVARRAGDEFVTAGGVTLSEIDSPSCMSRIRPNIYFVGEVLDIDGVTGGYNLSSSWSAGYNAGKNIAKKL